MNTPARIAFYAPLKPPDHPIPSGDRQMARMLLAALQRAGYDAFLASRLISYSKRHGGEHMENRKQAASSEADRLIAEWTAQGDAPDLWFCYHPYDKSPDWLGMEICQRLSIPMVTAEPCRTGQGKDGEWLPWRAEAQRSMKMASMNIVMTHSDQAYVSGFLPPERITWLDPFIDTELLEVEEFVGDPWKTSPGSCRLLAVGMMRSGAKVDSYTVLASALSHLSHLDWSLAIAGDGPARPEIEAFFDGIDHDRVHFLGECKPETVLGLMRRADVLAWPGCREAYGMVYLEAATQGTPSAALRNMGVPLVVQHGRTGLLAEPDDKNGYAECLARMIGNAALRQELGAGAHRFASVERSAEQAAAKLKTILDDVLARAGHK